jgi:N-methylhydantoinase B/oxoprolinase/acetone carboxylase alpha subunit
MMACEKTSKLIQEMVDHHGCDMWPQRFKQMADESDKELNALVAKVEELEAFAKVRRALLEVFAKGGYIQIPSERFDIDTEQDLLEWAKEVSNEM